MEEKAGVATVLSYGSGRGDPPAPRLRALRHPVAPCENEASASCSHIHGLMDTGELLAKSVALGEGDRAGDGGARTLRARVSWRTELFQEVLHRLQRWSLFHRTQARHQEVVVDIIKGASAHELNEMFLYVDCARFWKLCRKSTLDRLRTRLNDLGIPARAALLRGLIKVKKTLQHWWNSWVRDILLETKGEDLTLLKNMVDGGGDYHNLNKLLFKDMALMPQTVSTRKTILKHIQAEGRQIRQARHSNMAARPRVKIVSDIDDTLWSSGGHYPAGVDERLPKQVVYPGALALFREIIHDANSWQHSQRIDNLINSAKTLCVTCDSSTAGSDQSTSTPPPSVSPTTALNIALLPAPAPVTPSVPVLPYVGIQFGSAPSWNAVPELSSPSTTPWGSFDARKLKRVTSEPVLLQSMSGVPEDDEHGTAWCRVPGYFERHPAKYTDTLETVRKKIAHSLLVPERSLGQVHVDFSEMDQNFNTDCSLLFLSARPGIPRTRGMLERMVYGRFKELYGNNQLFTMPTLLPGSLMAGLKAISIQLRESFRSRRPLSLITSAWIPVGFQKMIALRNFAAIYPEYDYVFFGDNGQADAYVCDRLMWEPPMNHTTDVDLDVDDNNGAPHTLPHSRSSLTESSILVAFIHQVHDHHDVTLRSEAIGNRCICETCTRRMSEFTTYIGAAVQAVGHGLLSLRGLYVVGQEASEDFYRLLGASLVRGPFEKWRRTKADQLRCALNRDIQAANALLLDDMQLTPLMRVAEWRSALQPTRTQSPDSSRAGERNILGQAKAYSCAI